MINIIQKINVQNNEWMINVKNFIKHDIIEILKLE